jgi:hypothetical protein
MMKLALFSTPRHRGSSPWDFRLAGPAGARLAFGAMLLKLAAIGVGIVLIETGLAKMRIFR